MKVKYLFAACSCILFTAACSSASEADAADSSTAEVSSIADSVPSPDEFEAPYEAFQALPVACGGTAPESPTGKQYSEPVDQEIEPEQLVTATVTTSCGDLVLTLDPEAAPETVNSFVFLAREGFYEGIVSHRIVPGFVLQLGDPTARGDGGPGYSFDDELPASTDEYVEGAVVMANSGPNTNGSQIFINFANNSDRLGLQYSKFGQLTAGQDVLAKIAAIPTAGPQGDTPQEALYIENIEIEVS